MQKLTYLGQALAAVALLFASCNQPADLADIEPSEPANPGTSAETEQPADTTDLQTVSISFGGWAVETGTLTRGTALADVVTRLDVWLVEIDNYTEGSTGTPTLKQEWHQTLTDADFGTLSATLNKTRTYTLYAVAHKGDAAATLADGVVSFAENKITHSFWYTTSFQPAADLTLECEMRRMVGLIQLRTLDAAPATVSSMRFRLAQTYTAWSIAGHGTQADARTHTIALGSPSADGTLLLNLYVIATDEGGTIDMDIDALAADGTVVQTRHFADVPVQNNCRTRYEGQFFVDRAMQVSMVAADWTEGGEVVKY